MISITHPQVIPTIMALFDITHPTMPRAFNVLEGVTRGQILVDDPDQPTWAAVRETAFGTLYPARQINAALLDSLIRHFRQSGDVGLGCWLGSELNDILPPAPDYDGQTVYFTEHTPHHRDVLTFPLSEEYSITPRDMALLKQSPDFDMNLAAFGSIENIMQHTLGFVILRSGMVVCEAATGAPTHGRIEIGVNTSEPHRRRGLAAIACAHLIEDCEARGYSTWWDCARQNTASVNLARKLGYQNEREYRYVWWKGNK
jgi:RimJ/RimL family protein N-acetyltransferase